MNKKHEKHQSHYTDADKLYFQEQVTIELNRLRKEHARETNKREHGLLWKTLRYLGLCK